MYTYINIHINRNIKIVIMLIIRRCCENHTV